MFEEIRNRVPLEYCPCSLGRKSNHLVSGKNLSAAVTDPPAEEDGKGS